MFSSLFEIKYKLNINWNMKYFILYFNESFCIYKIPPASQSHKHIKNCARENIFKFSVQIVRVKYFIFCHIKQDHIYRNGYR